MINFIKRTILGFFVGVAAIMPGLSGGVIAAAMGIYEPAVRAVSGLFRKPKENIAFLLPLGTGVSIGIFLFSNVMQSLMGNASHEVLYFFFGLVVGSLPSVLNEANRDGFHPKFLWGSFFSFSFVLTVSFLGNLSLTSENLSGWSIWQSVLYGAVLAFGTIVPGISSTFLLIYLGAYKGFLLAIAQFDLSELIPFTAGFILAAFPIIKIVEVLFRKYHGLSYYAVLGFLFGSMALIFPGLRYGRQLTTDILLFVAGIIASLLFLKLSSNKNT